MSIEKNDANRNAHAWWGMTEAASLMGSVFTLEVEPVIRMEKWWVWLTMQLSR